MQFTGFPDSCTAGCTRHRQDLFWGEFFALHDEIIKSLELENCSILNYVEHIIESAEVQMFIGPPPNSAHYEHN